MVARLGASEKNNAAADDESKCSAAGPHSPWLRQTTTQLIAAAASVPPANDAAAADDDLPTIIWIRDFAGNLDRAAFASSPAHNIQYSVAPTRLFPATERGQIRSESNHLPVFNPISESKKSRGELALDYVREAAAYFAPFPLSREKKEQLLSVGMDRFLSSSSSAAAIEIARAASDSQRIAQYLRARLARSGGRNFALTECAIFYSTFGCSCAATKG